jgi:hypothetical protein
MKFIIDSSIDILEYIATRFHILIEIPIEVNNVLDIKMKGERIHQKNNLD